jgi:acetoin utilization protein AcuA
LAKSAQQTDVNIVLALAAESHIIGYGVLAYPDPGERWANLGSKVMMGITGLEVCRSWRWCRIASGILAMLLVKPQIEERIIYMVGYTWTWDLGGARKTSRQYRKMLVKLFERHGFAEYRTNEPNICWQPQN